MAIDSLLTTTQAEKPKKKILLVDDDASQTEAIKDFFEISSLADKYCLTIITASDGEKALSLYNSDKSIDAVITDYNMPNKDGVALTQELRASGYQGIIYGLSGTLDDNIMQKFTEAGATRQFTKPFDPEKLAARLEKDFMPKLVMIVDDDAEMRKLYRCNLRKNYRVIEASSAEEALIYFSDQSNEKPSVVFTDHAMGIGKTGLDLVKELIGSLKFPGVIYVLSGDLTRDNLKQEYLDAGVTRAYQKPVRFSHILPELSADLSPKQNL